MYDNYPGGCTFFIRNNSRKKPTNNFKKEFQMMMKKLVITLIALAWEGIALYFFGL